MPTITPDILIIGLGAMGSATAYQLAKRSAKVIGIDQFAPPHTEGSTHGETRITREAIGEGEQFVPLAQRSHQLWREMEAATGEKLLTACGGLILARTGQASHMHGQRDFLGNTRRAAAKFGIAHEHLNAADIARRFPQFILQGDETGYFEPGAGYLAPEACVRAQLALAARHGADLRLGETVRAITTVSGRTVVETTQTRYAAGRTVIAAGAWLPQLMPQIASTLRVSRQVLYWFEHDSNNAAANSSSEEPIFIWHWGDGADDVFYGFPPLAGGGTVKVATEQSAVTTTPRAVERVVREAEMGEMYHTHIAGRMRNVRPRCRQAVTCLYTSTPDANFLIDTAPDAADTIVVSACSGHGFKHSAAIGEAVAMMVTENKKPEVLRPFAWR